MTPSTLAEAAREGAPVADLGPRVMSFDPQLFEPLSGREEAWRFTPLRRLSQLHQRNDADAAVEYRAGHLAEGVNLTLRAPETLGDVPAPTDRVGALAFRACREAAVLTVGADADPGHLSLLTVSATGRGTQGAGHVHVDVEPLAEATVVIDHRGDAAYGGDITVRLGQGAHLTLAVLQRMEPTGVMVSSVRSVLGGDARLRNVAVTLGGDLVRLSNNVTFTAPGGEAQMLGTFFTGSGQHHEHRLFVDHSVPDCRSDVTYKGALAGRKAHSVWIGDVLIGAGATGTRTFETNRNLVLTDGARADAVPNLEIETGEIVGAGHASATGRLDEEHMFYLQSRGLTAARARRLVVRGFFADVVRRIGIAEVEESLMAAVDTRLDALAADEPVAATS